MGISLRIATPGTVLAGKLRVERLIGQGAMGFVVEATDITLGRRVAVKLVRPEHMGDLEKRLRFGREAYAVARLQSAHVTHVLEISELDDGTPYLVMELLAGRSLGAILETDGPASVDVTLDWMLQALDAIGEAHAIGLVHRDIKPENLYLASREGRNPIVKVLDFGLVKDTSTTAAKLTAMGSTMGSPAYMSPEQIKADPTMDARADVWAIGVTLHELLTGELPFRGDSIPIMLGHVLYDDPDRLRARRPDLPPELEAVVWRCLQKDPAHRYVDASEVSRALGAVRARLPQTSVSTRTLRLSDSGGFPYRPSANDGGAHVPAAARATASEDLPAPARAPIMLIAAAVVTAAVLASVGLAFVFGWP